MKEKESLEFSLLSYYINPSNIIHGAIQFLCVLLDIPIIKILILGSEIKT